METIWTDRINENVGDCGFLVEISNEITRGDRYELRDRPATTNRSFVPRLMGWCGTTNNVCVIALGIWRVVKISSNNRMKLEEVTDPAQLSVFLEEMGYPELASEIGDEK